MLYKLPYSAGKSLLGSTVRALETGCAAILNINNVSLLRIKPELGETLCYCGGINMILQMKMIKQDDD